MIRANAWIVGSIVIGWVIHFVRLHVWGHEPPRTLTSDVIQGILVGGALGFLTVQILAKLWSKRINGWTTMQSSGKGMLVRAAYTFVFPGPVNTPEEATYWTTRRDGGGRSLDGRHDYVLRFPPGGLPPNAAFWSLTMGDSKNRFVANPLHRYSVSDRTGLRPNPDGSIDIHIQKAAPSTGESNWLPAPSGRFILWLRVYLPGADVLEGRYQVPAVVRSR